MSHMRGEVMRCGGCDVYFYWTRERGNFECANCGETYCSNCAAKFVGTPKGWCRDCYENCCRMCGGGDSDFCRHSNEE